MQCGIESLDLLNLDQEIKLRPSSMWCVSVHIYKKSFRYNENQPNKKPKSVYLLSDFTANQKLHRIYFVQGKMPRKYLEHNLLRVLVYQISSNLCFK